MTTKPDSGAGENPGADTRPPSGAETDAETADESSADAAEVEVDVDASDGSGNATPGPAEGDEDSDIAIEVEAPEPESDPTAELRAQHEQLQAAHAELEAKQKDTYERLLRATADLDNFRKRARRDLENARTEARSKTLIEMLPVIDNLERAVAHAETSEDAKGIADGVNLVLRQFSQALERCGVAPVDAVGKPFDPNIHEAVSQVETADHPAGTVVEQLQKGYRIGERLLRPTLAVVSTAPAEPEEPPKPNGHDTSADAVTADDVDEDAGAAGDGSAEGDEQSSED